MINSNIYKHSVQNASKAVSVEGKRILVTGSTGLVGSCLVDTLMAANKKGNKNIIYAAGRSIKKLYDVFASYFKDDYFHPIVLDVCERIDDNTSYDFIINCASIATPALYTKLPVETFATNVIGAYNLLEYGTRHRGCKITLLSSFEVYGKSDTRVFHETDCGLLDISSVRACYPEGKRAAEVLARSFFNEYGVSVNVARLSSVFGPWMDKNDNKAHAQFLRNALKGEDVVLKSEGKPVRSYTYVLDVVSAIFYILFKGRDGEYYNVSNETSVASIFEVAQIIATLAGTKVVREQTVSTDSSGYTPTNCVLDNSKLLSLGWRAEYCLLDGLESCLKILKEAECE